MAFTAEQVNDLLERGADHESLIDNIAEDNGWPHNTAAAFVEMVERMMPIKKPEQPADVVVEAKPSDPKPVQQSEPEVKPSDGVSTRFEAFVIFDPDNPKHGLRRNQIIKLGDWNLLRERLSAKDDVVHDEFFTKHKHYEPGVVKCGEGPQKAFWPTNDPKFNQRVAQLSAQTEYDDAQDDADEQEIVELLDYPTHAWDGTPYFDFAKLAHGEGDRENNIPLEFFINGLMTFVGAIAGHRIVPEFAPFQPAHFYTILRTKRGGSGKGEVISWSQMCFDDTRLLYQSGFRTHKNIGAFHNDFASARALIEQFAQYPNILQVYNEFTTAIEKFGIVGSGTSFLDFNLNQYDTTRPNWSLVKGAKLPKVLPDHINNSMLCSTTEERWNETAGRINLETFIQRTNIVVADEVRTVFKLWTPDVTDIRQRLLERIGLLEEYKLVWNYTPEADEVGAEWHNALQDELTTTDDPDAAEASGRLQVFAHRIVGHMALWMGALPVDESGQPVAANFEMPNVIKRYEGADKIWRVEVTADMMRKAIEVCEYLRRARLKCAPPRGFGRALIENLIKKWASQLGSARWNQLKRRGNLRQFSSNDARQALENIESEGLLRIKKNPADKSNQRDWIVVWQGDGSTATKWQERRGGSNRKYIHI
jgi:hypothetical protein